MATILRAQGCVPLYSLVVALCSLFPIAVDKFTDATCHVKEGAGELLIKGGAIFLHTRRIDILTALI